VRQLAAVPEPVLDEIASPLGPPLEELHRVLSVRDLAEHEHGHVGEGAAKLRRDPDALVGAGRRHAYVGEHDIRLLLLHRIPERLGVAALAHDLDVILLGEDARDALPGQIAVVCDQNPDRHWSPLS
jgi:hypothetical protein